MNRDRHPVRFGPLSVVLILALTAAGCAGLRAEGAIQTDGASLTETISVTGFGEAAGTPDMATIQLGVEVEAESIITAVERSNATVAAVQAALASMGIAEADMRSTNFNVWREEMFDFATGQPTGEEVYHVDSTLMVHVRDIDRISEVIQTGLDAGANNIFGLTFGIDDTAELEAEARAAALEDARDRAEQLAAALGVSLGDTVLASELAGGGVSPFLLDAAFGRAQSGGGGPPLSPGELTVRIQVDVVYSIER